MHKTSYKVALGGIVSCLCLFTMFLTGVFPLFYLVLPMVAGILLSIIVEEIDLKWAFTTFFSISICSSFIVPDKEAVVMFILFFGHYPLVKYIIESIKLKFIQAIVKLLVYNICIISSITVTVQLLGITELIDELAEFGQNAGLILLIISNLFFLMYDMMITNINSIYIKWFKPKILLIKPKIDKS